MYRNHYERFKTYTPKTSHTLLLAHAVSLLLFSSDENKQEKKSKNSNTLSHVHEKKYVHDAHAGAESAAWTLVYISFELFFYVEYFQR